MDNYDNIVLIDQLPPVDTPSTAHLLPAMKDGAAGLLTVGQIVDLAIAAITDGAPAALDTLNELAAALADDSNYAATVASQLAAINTALGKRLRVDALQAFTGAEKSQARSNIEVGVLSGFRDKLINGDGVINQRTYTTVADDTYWCDRHYVLCQTAAITPTILANVANGLPSMMRLTQSQATAQRMGNAQIVESIVARRLRGKTVTLGGKLRSSASQAIRYAILEWTGTADAVTSDVVANWSSATYTAGNFFLGSNLTVAAVGTITPSANTVTDFSLTATISAACNNLIVILWTEATAAQSVTLDMVWGLVEGNASAETWPFGPRHPQQELALCQRYYETSGDGSDIDFCCDVTTAVGYYFRVPYKVSKRVNASVSTQIKAANRFPSVDPIFAVALKDGIGGQISANSTGAGGRYDASWIADAEL